MRKKTFVLVTVCSFVLMIAAITGFMIYIDPLFQYHQKVAGYKYPIINEIYQNPGIAKTFSYNAVVTGSSMMENNKMEWWNEYVSPDIHAVKLTYGGARAANIGIILRTALENNPNIQNIYAGCDVYLWGRKGLNTTLPEYLYDNNILNDVNYVLNMNLIFEYLMPVLLHKSGLSESTNMSEAYWWAPEDDKVTGEEVVEEYQKV